MHLRFVSGCEWICVRLLGLLAWTLAFTCCQAGGTPGSESLGKNGLAEPDYSVYHTLDALKSSISLLVESSSNLSIETLAGESQDEEYRTTMDVVTFDAKDRQRGDVPQYKVLIDFGEHGRELITTEVALGLLNVLSSPAARFGLVSKFADQMASDHPWLDEDLLSHTIIKIIPAENTNGRALVEAGKLCERKNGRGVDPNRNWAVDWGLKEPDYDPNEEYPGKYPFSEPESMLLRDIAEDFSPDMFINVHSGMEAMFVPYDHRLDIAYGVNVNATLEILRQINHNFCGGRCAVGSGGKEVGYLAHGTVTDYMHDVLNIPISSTWEIYGDMNAAFDDCFRMFNPMHVQEKDDVVDRWVASLLYAISGLARHPLAVDGTTVTGVKMTGETPRQEDERGDALIEEKEKDLGMPLWESSELVIYGGLFAMLLVVLVAIHARRRRGHAARARDRRQDKNLLPRTMM
jgi:hypothetical protein